MGGGGGQFNCIFLSVPLVLMENVTPLCCIPEVSKTLSIPLVENKNKKQKRSDGEISHHLTV